MSKHMEFYIQDDATSIQIGKNVYRRVSIPIDDFNAACDHYGFVKERTCRSTTDDNAWCFVCSECEKSFPRSQLHLAHNHGEINYCPNCGAKVVEK